MKDNFKKPMKENANKFFKTLDDTFHVCFKKIRIKSKSRKPEQCEIKTFLDLIKNLKQDISESKCKLGINYNLLS